ncbi:MAG: NfeD family protein [Verrucomicrobiota bacterium]
MTFLITLYIAGIALIIAELFLPGMIAGIVGGICIIGATVMAFHEFGAMMGFYITTAELFIGIVAVILWLRYFPQSRIGKFFSLKEAPPQSSAPKNFEQLLGASGKTVSPLHPTGIATLSDQRYDVVSEGTHIEAGVDIKVVKVEGIRIVVRAV